MITAIENYPRTTLVGLQVNTSFAMNHTVGLWKRFMPMFMGLQSPKTELYSIDVYPTGFFNDPFDPAREFVKWAAISFDSNLALPEEWETLIIPEGKYAVFHYVGNQLTAPEYYRNIYTKWIPEAGYVVDERPHFAVMGEKYKNGDPQSEEDIWIPIK